MPKKSKSESVLHDWVHELTFQQQALLLTAMRGPDACPKHNVAKAIVRYLRGVVIKPAGNWYQKNDNDFMWGQYERFDKCAEDFWADHDSFPHHFIMHLVHCAQVVGYKHPHEECQMYWHQFYLSACEAFHMQPEGEKEMDKRLGDFGCGYYEEKE